MEANRREWILGSAALALGAAVDGTGRPALAAERDDFYLSIRNPVANRDQRDLEALAIRLQGRPDVQAAIKRTAGAWARVTDHSSSPETWAMFPDQIRDYCFRSILMAVNSDPQFPKVLRVYSSAGHWMGRDVPASKWGAENPDNCYRIIPVEHGRVYAVHGQRMSLPPSYVTYQLVADTNTSITVGSLEQSSMDIAPDGSFSITLDESPPNGRRNHIQLTPDAMYLFVRDTLGDWRQTPDALRVECLTAPSRPALGVDDLAARAARIMQTGVYFDYYCIRLVLNVPMQSMMKPLMSGAVGGLVSQISSGGWFGLQDDEAAVIITDPVDAAYHSLVLYDLWARSLDNRNHQSMLNNAMLAPDLDGRVTSVISIRDPGVHNWLDTTDLHQVQVGLRWQGVASSVRAMPRIETRVIKLADIDSALPPGVRRVTAAERARQLAERRILFDRRFIDN